MRRLAKKRPSKDTAGQARVLVAAAAARTDELVKCLRAARTALVHYSNSGRMHPSDCNESGYCEALALIDKVLEPRRNKSVCRHCGEPVRIAPDGAWVHDDPDESPLQPDYGWVHCCGEPGLFADPVLEEEGQDARKDA